MDQLQWRQNDGEPYLALSYYKINFCKKSQKWLLQNAQKEYLFALLLPSCYNKGTQPWGSKYYPQRLTMVL